MISPLADTVILPRAIVNTGGGAVIKLPETRERGMVMVNLAACLSEN